MRKMSLILTGAVCIVAVTVMTSPARAQGCGPGPHWIDDCDAGEDNMPNKRALVGVDLNNNCDDVELNLILSGPVTVDRLDPSDDSNRFPGTRPVDGHLDVIDTEILSMSLTGYDFTLVAGAGQGQGGVLDHSYGAIAELPDDSLGESFFDVFFEIYVPPWICTFTTMILSESQPLSIGSHRLVHHTSNPPEYVLLSTQIQLEGIP